MLFINVFIRHLLKTELGSFFTEYLQVIRTHYLYNKTEEKILLQQQQILNFGWLLSDVYLKLYMFHSNSQNQLLTKGMVILRDKIRFYEGIQQLPNDF